MKKILVLLSLLLSIKSFGITYITNAAGNWNAVPTWNTTPPSYSTSDNLTINHSVVANSNITIKSGGILTINNTGILTINADVEFSNGSSIYIMEGGQLIVNGNFVNKNNSNNVTIDGGISVSGNFDNGTGGLITGGGNIDVEGDYTGGGSTFGHIPTDDIPDNSEIDGDEGLPIELISFKATVLDDKTVYLTWATLSETNNNYFTVEKSKDMINFTSVGTISGAGNSNQRINYQTNDINPFLDFSYYRLRQTDFDGKEEIFDPIVVNVVDDSFAYTIYPNPVGGNNTILFIKNKYSNPISISIYNEGNSLVYTMEISSEIADITIDFNLYEDGLYFLRIVNQTSQKTFVTKIIKSE